MRVKEYVLHCALALLVSASVNAIADEDSKGATVTYGAFFESELGWIQAKFEKNSENKPRLEFELEGFEPDDFFLVSLVHGDLELELAILVPDRGRPPSAHAVLEEQNWPMDLPHNFNEHTIFRIRDVSDSIIFEQSLSAE